MLAIIIIQIWAHSSNTKVSHLQAQNATQVPLARQLEELATLVLETVESVQRAE